MSILRLHPRKSEVVNMKKKKTIQQKGRRRENRCRKVTMGRIEKDAERVDEGPIYVAVAEADAGDGGGSFMGTAAGYTMQERWFNVAVAEYGNNQRKIIKHNSTAKDVIEIIESGDQWLESPDHGEWRLDPDEWMTVIYPYIREEDDVEFERVDEDTLRIIIDVVNESIHEDLRREMGIMCDRVDLSIYTRNKGNRFEESIIEVSDK